MQFTVITSAEFLSSVAAVEYIQALSIDVDELYCTYGILLDSLRHSEDGVVAGSQLLRSADLFALRVVEPGFYTFKNNSLNVSTVSRRTPVLGISVQNNSITLPVQALGIANTESVKIASFLYTGLEGVLGGSNFQGSNESRVISNVISTALLCGDTVCDTSSMQLLEQVFIQLVHYEELTPGTQRSCVSWNFTYDGSGDVNGGEWSERGCRLVEENSTPTLSVCACDHLTHFAILLSPRQENVAVAGMVILYVISGILVGVTLLIITLACVRSFASTTNRAWKTLRNKV